MITIKSSEFIVGAVDKQQFPTTPLPEIAFAGRSNVGKSSTLNCLVNRKSLAHVGATPGKTREINFFLINEAFRFVDLPGFGYAKVSKTDKERWQRYIEDYLTAPNRDLKGVIHVVDARHPGLENDLLMAEFLKKTGISYIVAANKIDKLKKNDVARQLRTMEQAFSADIIPFSAEKKTGRPELWQTIEKMLNS
ncbi:MAG: YihA family ribosome biogenesis GTP-binding protein [Victivallales bacterium]|nr:YihA family ribosome biogenesis GTP-binding protein [Victivallales bacterium]